ncbi:DUF2500 domain-containing protein [Sporosarcina oncorhynchi]|uniref:DUF2500 domain-containing protein n=1 Tax=Sporosarcina oncorhynchi TaxID=3056444 RepID=A0ABZ0L1L1_9BACL|nr:DUF2500 domain-containing protein [Sporosarcina sp. T2O-4]WOV86484.1 DUF2500 domain-containing protein [Sporosarcina sp. T2O-4]
MGYVPTNNTMDILTSILMTLVPFIIIGVFVFMIVRAFKQYTSNNRAPKLSLPAQLVTKRTDTYGGTNNSTTTTHYHVTFQVESGDRMEFQTNGDHYGLVAEGDFGILTYQGTRYLDFERKS